MSKHENRLAREKSPYLLQHAHNPVDWYPWGEEAFETARREDKPIFLSIGYSTCHWCHVMERESFEDPKTAEMLNDAFVCIKVDREERPDIDQVYMAACQALTGSGGWPLTIIMTPDREPFFAATYIPRENRFGMTGMLELIPRIKEEWLKKRTEIVDSAREITASLGKTSGGSPGGQLGLDTLKAAYGQLAASFDEVYGGFGRSPKFPSPHNLLFLLRYWKRTGSGDALEMVEKTLRAMRMGGIYDHVGFGFHRYSTDREWFMPHFEKMLYDQAMISMAYVEAFQATGKREYANAAEEVFSYVLRDMASGEGGFYSAEDADSEGVEGKFYLWTLAEIKKALGKEQAGMVIDLFSVTSEGNFAVESTDEKSGGNILRLLEIREHSASRLGMPVDELRRRLEATRIRLLEARQKRQRPQKDDKILTDWNGLMIAALAKGAQAMGEPSYAAAASKAADFVLTRIRAGDGRLLHRYRDGEAAVAGNVDDYAFMVWGLLELYEATFETRYLREALTLGRMMVDHFWDDQKSGFFFTSDDGEQLLVREKTVYDGAIPSGNSVAMMDLLRLGRLTGDAEFEKKASELASSFSGGVRRNPSAHTFLLCAQDFAIGPSNEVVIAGFLHADDTGVMLRALRSAFLPGKVVILRQPEEHAEIDEIAEFTKGMKRTDEKATAYVCSNHACNLPTTDPGKMMEQLGVPRPVTPPRQSPD